MSSDANIPFGFQVDDDADPAATKKEFNDLMAAMRSFMVGLVPKKITFDPKNISGFSGTSWTPITVVEYFLDNFSYTLLGDMMEVHFSFLQIAMPAGCGFIAIKIPDGYKIHPLQPLASNLCWIVDAGTPIPGLVQVVGTALSENHLQVYKYDTVVYTNTAGALSTQIRGQIRFRVVPTTT